MTRKFLKVEQAIDEILRETASQIRLATPLGLGKPNHLLNALYARIKGEPSRSLVIYTALSLNPPSPTEELARRFFAPFARRQWGDRYPVLAYAKDGAANRLPKNISVHEFYFQAGSALRSASLQQDYQSINYTRVAESVLARDVDVLVQLIAHDRKRGPNPYSLGSNPDVTLDLVELYRAQNKPLLKIGVVHPDMPFLGGEAAVGDDFFDWIVDDPMVDHELFALPRMPISDADHAIGFYASQLVADDGTLQVGIGSLSDAVVSSLILRHQDSVRYRELVQKSWGERPIASALKVEHAPFVSGLYGLSEMVTDGYMHLRRAGILKREVVDEKSGSKAYLHGAFFLGSKEFYAWLRSLQGDDQSGIRMTRVSKVNDLYDPHELLLRRQRKNARFLNTCMQVSLLGGAASETLSDGRVVSGVGGQYNFVSMSQELPDARSILMMRSVREEGGRRRSNMVWSLAHLTIPRHLRDIVITEYGIADLRGKTDSEVIRALLEITDSEFQPALVEVAQRNGKLSGDYQIPPWARTNTPENLVRWISFGQSHGVFGRFAMGSDFTPAEEKLVLALEIIQKWAAPRGPVSKWRMLIRIIKNWNTDSSRFRAELERMDLGEAPTLKAKIWRALLLAALR